MRHIESCQQNSLTVPASMFSNKKTTTKKFFCLAIIIFLECQLVFVGRQWEGKQLCEEKKTTFFNVHVLFNITNFNSYTKNLKDLTQIFNRWPFKDKHLPLQNGTFL